MPALKKIPLNILIAILFCVGILGGVLFINTDYARNLHLSHFSNSDYSSVNCTDQELCLEQPSYSPQLNDRVHQYLEESYLKGIKSTLKHAHQIDTFVKSGSLIPIQNSSTYIIDTLWYSYPFLTPKATNLLNEIGEQFQEKIKNTNLEGTRLVVTSVLRTTSSIKRLRRRNRNAVRHSAHLHGTTFDITYESFHHTASFSTGEIEGLKEILAKTLFELRIKKRCWVTFERAQTCFHIVSR